MRRGPFQTASTDRHARFEALVDERDIQLDAMMRERDLADELLHTRQTEPLGETLQRRLAMSERICRDLAPRAEPVAQRPVYLTSPLSQGSAAREGDIERRACGQGEQSSELDRAARPDNPVGRRR